MDKWDNLSHQSSVAHTASCAIDSVSAVHMDDLCSLASTISSDSDSFSRKLAAENAHKNQHLLHQLSKVVDDRNSTGSAQDSVELSNLNLTSSVETTRSVTFAHEDNIFVFERQLHDVQHYSISNDWESDGDDEDLVERGFESSIYGDQYFGVDWDLMVFPTRHVDTVDQRDDSQQSLSPKQVELIHKKPTRQKSVRKFEITSSTKITDGLSRHQQLHQPPTTSASSSRIYDPKHIAILAAPRNGKYVTKPKIPRFSSHCQSIPRDSIEHLHRSCTSRILSSDVDEIRINLTVLNTDVPNDRHRIPGSCKQLRATGDLTFARCNVLECGTTTQPSPLIAPRVLREKLTSSQSAVMRLRDPKCHPANEQARRFWKNFSMGFVCVVVDVQMRILGTYDMSLEKFLPGIELAPPFLNPWRPQRLSSAPTRANVLKVSHDVI